MRVAVVIALTLLAASSARASQSCMTKDEARSHFATSYLYWHGPDHCWDASPGGPQSVRKTQQRNVQSNLGKRREPNWREARSEVLSADSASAVPQLQPSEQNERASERSGGVPGVDQGEERAPAVRRLAVRTPDPMPALKATTRSAGPIIAAGGVILILLIGMVMVAVTEFLSGRVNGDAGSELTT
jgi:hypothetical protein